MWLTSEADFIFSKTFNESKVLTIWKDLANPFLTLCWGVNSVISRLSLKILPLLGFNCPPIVFNKVVFPEPLGPIRPKISLVFKDNEVAQIGIENFEKVLDYKESFRKKGNSYPFKFLTWD